MADEVEAHVAARPLVADRVQALHGSREAKATWDDGPVLDAARSVSMALAEGLAVEVVGGECYLWRR